MILVDIGNSGLRACKNKVEDGTGSDLSRDATAVFKLSWSSIGQEISKHRRLPTGSEHRRWARIDDDQGYDWLVQQVSQCNPSIDPLPWRIASVNSKALDRLLRAIERNSGSTIHSQGESIQIIQRNQVGIHIQVDYPDKVGIDRLLAAKAAIAWSQEHRVVKPIIVVQAGTALTVDWVDAQGRFQGGAILPGAGLALQYLAAGTDQLPWLPTDSIDRLPRLPGKNTEQAISAGVHASLVGGVSYLVARYRGEIGRNCEVPVLVSGGDGRLVLEHIPAPATYVDNLVLLGLALCEL